MTAYPVLIACAHGTRSLEGRAVVKSVVDGVRALAPELDVREAFVDIEEPEIAAAVADAVRDGSSAVVVPLLLSTGFHVRHDIAAAVEGHGAVSGDPMGPDERLVTILVERLKEAGATPSDAVVLAAAGSSDPAAVTAVTAIVDALRERWGGPVTVGYGAAATPSVADAVTAARETGADRVVVASYLLAPGHFHSTVERAGADVVTTPLGPHPLLAEIALDRYRETLA